jgi:1,4-alpha-glucan branching enzyme
VFSAIYPRAQQVQIAGDFNEWNPENTTLNRVDENGKWQLKMPLNRGLHRYRLVVDGQWQQDPYNDWIEMNPFGEFNSVLNVE